MQKRSYNTCVKIDLKIPIRFGKMSENRMGGIFFFDSHCILTGDWVGWQMSEDDRHFVVIQWTASCTVYSLSMCLSVYLCMQLTLELVHSWTRRSASETPSLALHTGMKFTPLIFLSVSAWKNSWSFAEKIIRNFGKVIYTVHVGLNGILVASVVIIVLAHEHCKVSRNH